jgi:hypothetical protein
LSLTPPFFLFAFQAPKGLGAFLYAQPMGRLGIILPRWRDRTSLGIGG